MLLRLSLIKNKHIIFYKSILYIIKKGPLIRALLNVNYWNEFFVFPSANISTDEGYSEAVDV